jgi:CRISPR system Cascade subunit CasE
VIPETALGAQEAMVSERHTARFDRPITEGDERLKRGRVSISHVTYQGVLDVTDAPALRRALTTGMGRAKAYGCGLMTLAHEP